MSIPRPPFQDANRHFFSEDEVKAFALRTGWVDDIGVINNKTTRMESVVLAWWPDHKLVLASDPAWGPVMAAWVLKEGARLVRLDGTSPPIHALNKDFPPKFTPENVLSYLAFFCHFVHGEEGPFSLMGDSDVDNVPPETDRSKIDDLIRAPELLRQEAVEGEADTSSFHFEAVVYYSNALFLSNFHVKPNGMIEMLEDEPLAADLEGKIALKLKFEIETPKDESESAS